MSEINGSMVNIIGLILVNSITCLTERPNSHLRPAPALGFPLLHKPGWLLFSGQEASHAGLPLPYTLTWYTQTHISYHIVPILLFSDLSCLGHKCQSCVLLSPHSEDILLIHFWLYVALMVRGVYYCLNHAVLCQNTFEWQKWSVYQNISAGKQWRTHTAEYSASKSERPMTLSDPVRWHMRMHSNVSFHVLSLCPRRLELVLMFLSKV